MNGARIDKSSKAVGAGDVVTFMQARRLRVIEILDVGERRGPASEAAALYRDCDEQTAP